MYFFDTMKKNTNIILIVSLILGLFSIFFVNKIIPLDIRTIDEFQQWILSKKVSKIYREEKLLAKRALLLPAQYDQPSQYWKNLFDNPNDFYLDLLFYKLKIWFAENDLKRLELRSSYPVSVRGVKSEGVVIQYKQRKNIPGIEIFYTNIISSNEIKIQSININNDDSFNFDINNDENIDLADVWSLKQNKSCYHEEYSPGSVNSRKFRSWPKEDKERLLDVVNSNCIETYNSWEELFDDRYVKCDTISRGKIGWNYWSLPGSRSAYSTKLPECFIIGILIPGILIYLFTKYTKYGRALKLKTRFKFFIAVYLIYFGFVLFIFAPATILGVKAI